MNIVLENGGEDLNDDGDNWEIVTPPNAYEPVLEAVKKGNIQVVHSELGMVPQNYIKLEGPAASQMIRLLEAIEDHDDVQNVYSNFDVDQKQLEEVAS
jgi:transcriptional/translational regulatory protein YebC/TACO1